MVKNKSIKTLTNSLDRVFSEFIRLRDSDINGMIKCYCCGKVLYWRDSENMHFIPRQHKSVRYSEINCHAGCTRCNHYLNGNIEEYTIHLKRDYGNDIVEKLTAARNTISKPAVYEYEALIKYYKNEVKCLKSAKNLKTTA